jgi:hypothetical protein
MRKLREAIVSSHRHDVFAQRTYLFLIHSAILFRSWESYQPALLYLLHTIHRHTPLSESELEETVGYLVLDAACRVGDLHDAYALKRAWKLRRGHIDSVLKAVVRDDYIAFWRLRGKVDGYQRAIMEFHDEHVRLHALKCLGLSYLHASKKWIETCASMNWEDLKSGNVAWELVQGPDGEERVQIRSVEKKTNARPAPPALAEKG